MHQDIAAVHTLFAAAEARNNPANQASEVARLRRVHAALRLVAAGLTATAASLGVGDAVGAVGFEEPTAFDMAGCDLATIAEHMRAGTATEADLLGALSVVPIGCIRGDATYAVVLPLVPKWLADDAAFPGAFGVLDESIRSGCAVDSLDRRSHRKHWRHIVAALHTCAEALADEDAAHRLLTTANTITSHVGA